MVQSQKSLLTFFSKTFFPKSEASNVIFLLYFQNYLMLIYENVYIYFPFYINGVFYIEIYMYFKK